MNVLVVTVVHTPLDARIYHRQIRSLRDADISVTYAAPWSATATPRPSATELLTVDLPRAQGRRRLAALLAARQLLRREGHRYDVILLHDPELLLAVVGQLRRLPTIVHDVHEDTATALIDRPWLPGPLRGLAAWTIHRLERWAEDRVHLLLAERSYQDRFGRHHPFVPNVPPPPDDEPPPPGDRRVVYLGRIARSRGALEILAVAADLHEEVTFELIGPADPDVEPMVAASVAAGHLRWHGFVPNAAALPLVDGALVGLSLVHPQPNHAGSLQTKVLEYLSRRVPVISSDLPVTGAFVRDNGVGLVVPAEDPDAVAAAIRHLRAHPAERRAMAERGYTLTRDELNWDIAGAAFVATIRALASSTGSGGNGDRGS